MKTVKALIKNFLTTQNMVGLKFYARFDMLEKSSETLDSVTLSKELRKVYIAKHVKLSKDEYDYISNNLLEQTDHLRFNDGDCVWGETKDHFSFTTFVECVDTGRSFLSFSAYGAYVRQAGYICRTPLRQSRILNKLSAFGGKATYKKADKYLKSKIKLLDA